VPERILEEIDDEDINGQESNSSSGRNKTIGGTLIQNLSVSASVCQSEMENRSETSVCVSGTASMSSTSLLSLSMTSDPKLHKPKFDFLYKRTCFRLMSEFFKDLFQTTVAKGKKVSREFQKLMVSFCQSEHVAPVMDRLPGPMQHQLYRYLLVVLHSHRHRVEGEDISEAEIAVIRDVMYKYSKKAMEAFIQVPELSFLFLHFATHPSAKQFIMMKIEGKGIEYVQKMLSEITVIA